MKITLEGSIPVFVVVNLESSEIDRVVAGDDHLTMGQLAYNEDGDPYDLTDAQRAAAEQIMADATWPSWEWGW